MSDDIASLLLDLPPWQKRIMAHVLDGGKFEVSERDYLRAQRQDKARAIRMAVEVQALTGGSAHVAGPDGYWCVTAQPVGFLWARLPEPERGFTASQVIYDEA